MNVLHTIRIAFETLLRNKLRSFLTLLGVVIGVFAVIAMVAAGDGARARVQQLFAMMGSNMLVILPGARVQGGVTEGFGSSATLTWDDLKAIQSEVPSVRFAAALSQVKGQAEVAGHNWATSINGTSSPYFAIRDWPIAKGACFTDSDVKGRAKVAVLGEVVVRQLFGWNVDPVGQIIRVNNVFFRVVGVLTPKGQSPHGQDNDDAVFVPETTFQSVIQGGLQQYIPGTIVVGATSQDVTDRAQRQITALLRDRHHLRSGMEDDFSIRNLTDIAHSCCRNNCSDIAAGGYCRRVSVGRRHRDHEHHAGERHRAHQGDRAADGSRCQDCEYPLAVSRGVRGAVARRGNDWHRPWGRNNAVTRSPNGLVGSCTAGGDCACSGIQRSSGRWIWALSGAEGIAAGSHRSLEIRIAG